MPSRHAQAVADSELVDKLVQVSEHDKRLIKASDYVAPAIPEMTVQSWKMNEYKYNVIPSPFPTLARGLFTTQVGEPSKDEVVHKIVARGYDKFFNIGEVPWTTWASIEKHTAPPYSMTLKSNGCIIFISALSSTRLLVTSKHSLGPLKQEPNKTSHAQMGERWLEKQLNRKGRTTEELAQVLWDNNWTAVAELCDDSFEEHVLAYPPEKSGLHLHGLNDSAGVFKTQPMDKVNAFAKEWGFFETPFHVEDTVGKVRAFTEGLGKEGKWNGEPIEGFVVRCYVKDGMPTDGGDAPPYPPGSSFFFKVKYDEPYMMYRDWREITKAVLGGRNPPQWKLRRTESRLYLDWVRKEIEANKSDFKEYTQGKGIIATRQKFLDWLESDDGKRKVSEASLEEKFAGSQIKTFKKTIIVPVAIPGCGKTTVAVALKRLFGFGHVQSDDINVRKKPGEEFIKRVLKELEKHDVVIADKNNHQKVHRDQLRDAINRREVRLLALYWPLDKSHATIHRICSDRIETRGENHQKLRPGDDRMHEEVVWKFLHQAEELADDEADRVIEMDLTEDIEQTVARAVDACVRVIGVPAPSQEDIGRALAAVHDYKPDKIWDIKKKAKFRYYGLVPEPALDLEAVVGAALTEGEARRMWESLRENKRVADSPHVTIVHSKRRSDEEELWQSCANFYKDSSSSRFDIKLGHVVYDDKVMAITVDDLRVEDNGGSGASQSASDFVASLPKELKTRLHITVGTRDDGISAVNAGILVAKWKAGEAKDAGSVPLNGMIVKGRLKGLF